MEDLSPSQKCPNCGLNPWKERMLRLATDPKFHDVSFIVGHNKVKIGCNRSLLSIHCPVFEAMFCNQMLESISNSVEIPDINPIVFAAMLQWMSTNTLNIQSICDLNALIKLADKYQITGLIEKCCSFLHSNTITIHIVTDAILCNYHSVDLGLKNLKEMSIKLRILSYSSINDVILAISKQLNWNYKLVKLWRVSNRKNATIRPNRYLSNTIHHMHNHQHNTNAFNNMNNKKENLKDDIDNDQSGDIDIDDLNHDNMHNNIHSQQLLFNINDMKCNMCYNKQNNNNNNNNSNNNNNNNNNKQKKQKKIDWSQYSGIHPTKAIYARLCQNNNENNEMKVNNQNPNQNNENQNKNFNNKILLFLKYYDVYHECLSLVSSILVDKNGDISLILKSIREIASWSDEREILLFEEEDFNNNKINPIKLNQSISESSLVDGDIIVFQESSNIFTHLKLKNVTSYFQQYCDNNNNNNNQRNNNRTMSSSRMRRISSQNNNNNHNIDNNNAINPIPIDVDDPYNL